MRKTSLLADLSAGAASALVALPVAIGGGILVTAPLGQEYASLGVKAGLICAVIAALVTACFGSSRFSIGGPSSTTSIVLAGALVHLTEQGANSPARIALLMAIVVALSGSLLVLSGVLRWGNLVKFIPRPVLAGFVNGVALLLVYSQLGASLGLSERFTLSPAVLPLIHWGAPLVTLLTVWVCLLAQSRKFPLPPQFVGLAMGLASHYLLQMLFGSSTVGPVVGELPSMTGFAGWLEPASAEGAWLDLPWVQIIAATLLLTLLGAVQTLMTAVTVDSLARTRHESNRELIAFGLGNIASAIAGGIPSSANQGRAMANYRAGARTRLSGAVNGAVMCGIVFIAAPLISKIPMAVMAGLLIHSATAMVDRWTIEQLRTWLRRRGRHEVRENVMVISIISLGMIWLNPVTMVAIGVVLSMGLFLKRMAKTFIRRSYDCTSIRSLKVRPAGLNEKLREHGHKVHVIELEGALFFGTADRLRHVVESHHQQASHIILDCRRVREWDATGVQIVAQLYTMLIDEGRHLLLAHVAGRKKTRQLLASYGLLDVMPASHLFADTDHALEYVENQLLSDTSPEEIESLSHAELRDTTLLQGLTEADQQILATYFDTFSAQAGQILFHIGDPGDQLFVLLEGEVTLGLPINGRQSLRRLLTITPGVVFGEMALLDAQARSACAEVNRDASIKALSRSNFERMRTEHPALFARLMQNIAHEMSLRLRLANQQLRTLED
jgi:sulfate permease, SulP family